MTVQILESGKADLREGRRFYETQGGRWLGSYCFDTLFSAIDSLAIYAGIHERRYGFYWMLVPHFPYSVYYDIEDGLVNVYAVVDNRRDPDWILRHLQTVR